jgi:sulfite reductase (ferredoxin)
MATMDEAVRGLRIKTSGCFNSCGQHHVADLGFFGNSRTVGQYKVPHFQVLLGGKWADNADAYGLAIGAVPSKHIPEVVSRITSKYAREREANETFYAFVQRAGKQALRAAIEDLMQIPPYEEDSSLYTDWGDPREFTLGDLGAGECAGAVVSLAQFGLADAERMVFEAQLHLEAGEVGKADETAYGAMLEAARSLVKTEFLDVPDNPDAIVSEFRSRFCDTEIFTRTYGANRFAFFLFNRHEAGAGALSAEQAHRLIQEAQLFIEAAHACYDTLAEEKAKQTADVLDSLP